MCTLVIFRQKSIENRQDYSGFITEMNPNDGIQMSEYNALQSIDHNFDRFANKRVNISLAKFILLDRLT